MQLDWTWLSRYWKKFEWFIKKDYVDINVRDNRGETASDVAIGKVRDILVQKAGRDIEGGMRR